tara:strand:- start:1577 stop:2044 length:468 start_codon:yes stop_codon:yes gene_type:complete
MNKFSKVITTLFGIGFSPFMPGTIASFITLTFYYIILDFIDLFGLIIVFLFIFIFSIYLINIYTKKINKHDTSEIVIDEFLGITFIIIFYKMINFTNDFVMFIIILILFRFFDIFKIFPANIIDKKMTNPIGVLLDDIIAGIYCVIMLYFINEYI